MLHATRPVCVTPSPRLFAFPYRLSRRTHVSTYRRIDISTYRRINLPTYHLSTFSWRHPSGRAALGSASLRPRSQASGLALRATRRIPGARAGLKATHWGSVPPGAGLLQLLVAFLQKHLHREQRFILFAQFEQSHNLVRQDSERPLLLIVQVAFLRIDDAK